MKKIIQNILAQKSKGEIVYLCGKCGKEVEKEAIICNHCNAKLGKIRCPFCNFIGSIDDFKLDTCPRCGRKNKSSKNLSKNDQTTQYSMKLLPKKLFWFLLVLLISIIIILSIIFIYNFELL